MENRPEINGENGRTVESILQTVTQDLKHLHQGLVTQLSQEVTQLQAEKARLTEEVGNLQTTQQVLQTRQQESLSQQQIAQQQLWAKQLALVLANHLQSLMVQQVNQLANTNQLGRSRMSLSSDDSDASDHAHRLLASLDTTFSVTFKALQQELTSYESSLSQQLGRMHNLEQQGEAVLELLVSRIRDQLLLNEGQRSPQPSLPQENSASPQSTYGMGGYESGGVYLPTSPPPQPPQQQFQQGYPLELPVSPPRSSPPRSPQAQSSAPISSSPLAVPGAPLPQQAPAKKELSSFWTGLCLVLLSTVALSIHNVVVRIIGNGGTDPTTKVFQLTPARVLDSFDIGGFVQLNLGNSLLILGLRMVVVLPLMVILAMLLYPPVWRDLSRFFTLKDRKPIWIVVGSGIFLFLSQVLIYIAIGQIGPGPAVTILFMYPIFTVPLAWFLFGDRPTPLRWAVMGTILTGIILTALPQIFNSGKGFSPEGILIAIGSGVAFALYLILMQLGFKKLHPIPVTLIQFSTIFVLSAVILFFLGPNLGVKVEADKLMGFLLSGIVLGCLTLVGYLSNNFGVRYMGAGLASIVASIGPVMTALLAWVLIQNKLQGVQWFGIFLVTAGVGALSFERMKLQTKKK
ncbi:MAG: EamA family transporter [Leptolyngbya sp.]|nr:MAG: EamA family transporter [Leptolyngbya sp.]